MADTRGHASFLGIVLRLAGGAVRAVVFPSQMEKALVHDRFLALRDPERIGCRVDRLPGADETARRGRDRLPEVNGKPELCFRAEKKTVRRLQNVRIDVYLLLIA